MPYANLCDGFYDHPKIDRAGNEAAGVFARMLSYSSKHLTDGFVPKSMLTGWLGRRLAPLLALENEGLIREAETDGETRGYLVVGYLDYNHSKTEILQRRRAAAEKKRRQRAQMSLGDTQGDAPLDVPLGHDPGVPRGRPPGVLDHSNTKQKTLAQDRGLSPEKPRPRPEPSELDQPPATNPTASEPPRRNGLGGGGGINNLTPLGDSVRDQLDQLAKENAP